MKPEPTYAFATFENVRDTEPKQTRLTWEQIQKRLTLAQAIEDKEQGQLYSPVTYKAGTTRSNENVEAVEWCVLDFDHDVSKEEALTPMKELGLSFIYHTTHSHTPESPRFRVAIPLSEPVSAPEWKEVWKRIEANLAPETDGARKDAAGMYYLPAVSPDRIDTFESEVCEGVPLDASILPPLPAELARVEWTGKPEEKPISRYVAERVRLEDLLLPRGWKFLHASGGKQTWQRPGLNREGGNCVFYEDKQTFHVFTSEAPAPLECNRSYTLPTLWVLLEHGGDYRAALRSLPAEHGQAVENGGDGVERSSRDGTDYSKEDLQGGIVGILRRAKGETPQSDVRNDLNREYGVSLDSVRFARLLQPLLDRNEVFRREENARVIYLALTPSLELRSETLLEGETKTVNAYPILPVYNDRMSKSGGGQPGLSPGDLFLYNAATGHGKSYFYLACAKAAVEQGLKVVYLNLEGSVREMEARLARLVLKYNPSADQIARAVGPYVEGLIYTGTGGRGTTSVPAIRRYVEHHKADVLIIDYLRTERFDECSAASQDYGAPGAKFLQPLYNDLCKEDGRIVITGTQIIGRPERKGGEVTFSYRGGASWLETATDAWSAMPLSEREDEEWRYDVEVKVEKCRDRIGLRKGQSLWFISDHRTGEYQVPDPEEARKAKKEKAAKKAQSTRERKRREEEAEIHAQHHDVWERPNPFEMVRGDR